jgi:hypothetical protein
VNGCTVAPFVMFVINLYSSNRLASRLGVDTSFLQEQHHVVGSRECVQDHRFQVSQH